MLLCMLEAVEGELCLLKVLEVMRCVLLCMLEAVEGGLCLLEVLEVLEVMCLVQVCMLGGCIRNFHCGSFLVRIQSATIGDLASVAGMRFPSLPLIFSNIVLAEELWETV